MVFSTYDMFSHLKYDIMKVLTCFKTNISVEMENKKRILKESEILYHEGYEAVVQRLDLINIVRKIEKLEAGLSAVIQNDDDMMRRTREFYLSNTTLLITLDKHHKC